MKNAHTLLSITIGAFLLSSCATTRVETQAIAGPSGPEALSPETQTEPSQALSWTRRFGDSTLNRLVEEALDANLGLDAAKAQARATEAAARISGALKFPGLSLGLSSSKQQSRFAFLGFQKIETDTHSLTLGAQWEADLWGRLSKAHASGLASAEAAEADVQALRLSIAGQVARAWFNLIEANRQWALARDSAEAMERKQTSLERRYERGLASNLDLRLTRAQKASSQALATRRKTELADATRALEVLLGRYPSATQKSAIELPRLETSIPSGLSSILVARRPDLLAAERRLATAIAQSEATSRNWLPQIRLTGNTGTTSDEFSQLLETDLSVWTIAGEVAAPLFSAGRLKAERDQADAQRDVHLARYRQTALEAFQEVESALSANEDLEQLYRDTAIAAEENEKAEGLAWDQYERGLIDITALLDAQRRADDSASQLISVQNLQLQNRIQLHLALGGDFE